MLEKPFVITDTLLRANSKGSTFFPLSTELKNEITIGTPCHLILKDKNKKEILRTFAKVAKARHQTGFTPPKHLTKQLIGTKLTTTITPLSAEGWITKIGNDNTINIPYYIIEQTKWKDNDLIEIKIQQPNNLKQTTKSTIRLFSRKRPKQKQETNATLHIKSTKPYERKKIYVTPIRKLKNPTKPKKLPKNTIWIPDLFPNAQIGEIREGVISLHLGRHFPIQISVSFSLTEIAHYMGCYFADGDKSANTCGISASTIEQGNYYLKMQKLIILEGESYRFDITYTKLKTDKRSDDLVKKEIISYWVNNVPIDGPLSLKLRLSIAKSKPTKWNEFGSLRIRGRTAASLFLIKKLLSWTVNKLIPGQYYKEGLDFFCGLLEGDGSPGDPTRGVMLFYGFPLMLMMLRLLLELLGVWVYYSVVIRERIELRLMLVCFDI
ncbi:MAG: hypothetical protein ACTSUV_00305 [Candidatus Ranarchaeia archaeon]